MLKSITAYIMLLTVFVYSGCSRSCKRAVGSAIGATLGSLSGAMLGAAAGGALGEKIEPPSGGYLSISVAALVLSSIGFGAGSVGGGVIGARLGRSLFVSNNDYEDIRYNPLNHSNDVILLNMLKASKKSY